MESQAFDNAIKSLLATGSQKSMIGFETTDCKIEPVFDFSKAYERMVSRAKSINKEGRLLRNLSKKTYAFYAAYKNRNSVYQRLRKR